MEQLNKKKHFNMPHTFVIIGIILLICVILCFIIPSGEFDRVIDENGRSVVVAGTYHEAEGTKPTLLSVFMAIFNGMGDASDIIFFIFFSYGLVYVTLETGALDAGIGTLLRIMKNKTSLLVPFFMLLFGVNFNLYFLLLLKDWKSVLKNEELRAYLGVIAAAIAVITVNILNIYPIKFHKPL